MKIINQYEEDGYTITEYDTGHIVKEIIGDPVSEAPIDDTPVISEVEATLTQTYVNTEYLVCLADLGL